MGDVERSSCLVYVWGSIRFGVGVGEQQNTKK